MPARSLVLGCQIVDQSSAKTLAKRRAQRHRARLVRVREDDERLLAVTVGLRRNYRLRMTMRVLMNFVRLRKIPPNLRFSTITVRRSPSSSASAIQ